MNTSLAADPVPICKVEFSSAQTLTYLAVCFVLLGWLFYERFHALVSVWLIDGNYSHGFLILPISIWLAYQNLKNSKVPLEPDYKLGCFSMFAGMVVHLFGSVAAGIMQTIATELNVGFLMDFLALALLMRGGALVIGGKVWASAFTFPLWFLFFMFPLPVTWTNFTSVWLQDWVSTVSGSVLSLFFVCHQQGNVIEIAGAEPIHVAQECSGLRQLVAFVALATLVGYLSKKGMLFGLIMILAAIPVAIISNVLRVLLMAVVIRYLGAESVSGWMHDVPALITLPVGLFMFFVLHQCIGDFFGTSKAPVEEST